jgi:flagellar assembly protein FliH
LSAEIIRRAHAVRVQRVDLAVLAAGGDAPVAAVEANAARDQPPDAGQFAELERVRQQAYAEGYEAARNAGQALVDQQRADLLALVAGVNELMQDFEQRLASDVLSISLELAKLIMRQTLRVKPDVVLAVVREAIASLPGLAEQTMLVLNPADAALLRELGQGEGAAGPLPWRIVEDAQIERGGCKLETATTEVDATLETRWRRVIASLGREDPWIEITI